MVNTISWLKSWIMTTNHKRIGILYIVTSLYFFFVAGTLAVLFRLQLAMPESQILGAKAFNQAVTGHGLLMLLWFLSPLQFGLANYIVPLQIGARDLAFPRLNALSYWLYLFSGILMLIGFFAPGGAADVGWTLYAPLNTAKYTPARGVDIAVLSILMFAVSVTLGTINFLVTIIKMRAPGMTWDKLPMFPWSIIFTVLLMLLAFPALGAASLLLLLDRNLGTTFYIGKEGGALLWDHLFWFFGHPEVYILLFPSLGVLADVISAFSGRPLYAKRFVIVAFIAATILSYIVWMHHMFITGTSLFVRKLFSVTTALISIPFEMATLSLILTLYKARIRYTIPMMFALASIPLFIIGGATGVFNAAIILDRAFRGTYWVVAHFHYIMAGTALFGMIAGLYYWFPKITGKMISEGLAKLQLVTALVGVNLLYFPQFLLMDMPRRVLNYNPEWTGLNQLSTVGSFIYGFSFLIGLIVMLRSLYAKKKSPENPWGTWGIEWLTSSPPPSHDFDGTPVVLNDGSVYLIDENSVSRDDLYKVIEASDEKQIARITKKGDEGTHSHKEFLTFTPVLLALGLFAAFFGIGFMNSWVISLGTILFVVALYLWAKEDFSGTSFIPAPKLVEDYPFSGVDKFKLAIWTFIAGEGFLFGSLIGAYIFIRSRSTVWTPGYTLHDPMVGLFNTVILFTAALAISLGYYGLKKNNYGMARSSVVIAFLMGLLFLLIKLSEWIGFSAEGYGITSSIEAQLYYVLTGAHASHVIAGLIATYYVLKKISRFKSSNGTDRTVFLAGVYWGIVDIVWVFLFPMFYLS